MATVAWSFQASERGKVLRTTTGWTDESQQKSELYKFYRDLLDRVKLFFFLLPLFFPARIHFPFWEVSKYNCNGFVRRYTMRNAPKVWSPQLIENKAKEVSCCCIRLMDGRIMFLEDRVRSSRKKNIDWEIERGKRNRFSRMMEYSRTLKTVAWESKSTKAVYN